MVWLKTVHDCMRRYFPEEVTEMESREDPTSYLEVRDLFNANFSRPPVALRQSVDTLYAVVSENCVV